MFQNIPKKVGIIVKSGQYLEYAVPGSKKSSKTCFWEVIFKGSKDKMTTELIEATDGCPVWDCDVTLDLVSPADPIVMLVQDGKHHHIGQVVVPLDEVPQTGPPNFDPSRLRSSELGRTKKNSNPRGRLLYWIWAISYWPPGTNPSLAGSKSKSLRGSLSNLSVHRSKHHKKSTNNGNDDGQSSCGSLARAPSMVSGAAPSIVSGGSFSESMLPPSGGIDLPPGAPRGPYNPMAFNDDDRASVASGGSQSYSSGRPPIYQHHFHQNAAASLGPSDDSASIRHKGKNRILSKMKSRLSKSSLHLNKAAALAGGEKVYSNGSLLSVRTGDDRPRSSTTLQYRNNQAPREESPGSHAAGNAKASTAGSHLQVNPSQAALGRQSGSATPNNLATPNSPAMAGARNDQWGLHPEERPHKPLEEMSQREVKEYALQMEHKFQVSKAEVARLQTENAELVKRAETAEKDLSEVGVTLATLRIKLLEDNLTDYLEVPSDGSDGYLNFGSGLAARGQFRRSMSTGHLLSRAPASGKTEGATAGQPLASPVQSFFAKLSAISLSGARKPNTGDGAAADAVAFDRDSSPLSESTNGDTGWW